MRIDQGVSVVPAASRTMAECGERRFNFAGFGFEWRTKFPATHISVTIDVTGLRQPVGPSCAKAEERVGREY